MMNVTAAGTWDLRAFAATVAPRQMSSQTTKYRERLSEGEPNF